MWLKNRYVDFCTIKHTIHRKYRRPWVEKNMAYNFLLMTIAKLNLRRVWLQLTIDIRTRHSFIIIISTNIFVIFWRYWIIEVKGSRASSPIRLVPAQDGPFFYTRSHLSALQNCALLFSTNFQIIFIFKKMHYII